MSRPAWPVVLGLLTACLIPRAWAATLHDVVCPDAVAYLGWAEVLEAGNALRAFRYTGINIYQPLLLGLKWLPCDWLLAAKWWSVAMATLAVLPIYGWIRRQFNETLAIIGCGFYVLHPAMVHDSPLIVRDPTFWLLFSLGLYTAWRAVSELRYRWFGLFALVFGLAIYCRTEGWLLLPVLLTWIAFRLWHAKGRRIVILLATSMAITAGPLTGWLIQKRLTAPPTAPSRSAAPSKSDRRIVGGKRHFRRARRLAEASSQVSAKVYVDGTARIAVRYIKGFGYLHGLLALAGILHWRLRLLRPSKGPLLIFCLLSGGAIWISFCLTEMDRRYVYPSVIVSLPTIAAGLCLVSARFAAIANHKPGPDRRGFFFWAMRSSVVSGLILSAIIVLSPRPLHHDQAEIGRWIRRHLGAGQKIGATPATFPIIEFYSDGDVLTRLPQDPPNGLHDWWNSPKASRTTVLLFGFDWRDSGSRASYERGIAKAREMGFREVPSQNLPESCRRMLVLTRASGTESQR